MTPNPPSEIIERIVWGGVNIELRYERDWSGLSEMGPAHQIAHIVVQVIDPAGAPLPITETGYFSHFLRPEEVWEAGGLVPFVRAWLDRGAGTPMWRRIEAKWRQLDLFG